jgi:hypothetical protein
MTDTIRAEVDRLAEKLFGNIRSSASKHFLRYNFNGGVMSLSLLASHEWVGMVYVLLMILLTPEGESACKSCFSANDCNEPDYDWDNAPKFDPDRTHIPEILQVDADGDAATHTTSAEVAADSESAAMSAAGVTVADDPSAVDDSEGVEEQEEDEDATISQQGSKKKKNQKRAPLPCSRKQFTHLLEEMLVFHAFYKLGNNPFNSMTTPGEVDPLLSLPNFLVLTLSGKLTPSPSTMSMMWLMMAI